MSSVLEVKNEVNGEERERKKGERGERRGEGKKMGERLPYIWWGVG
jgi:hypothetical protein